jgi:membrane-associated phospholipid phosphatase
VATLMTAFRRRYGGLAFHAVDIISLGYMFVSALLIIGFHHRIPNWYAYLAVHGAYIWLGVESIRWSAARPDNRALAWVRMLYPAFIIVYGFLEVGKLQYWISSGNAWVTPYLVSADLAVFGVHPTVWMKDFFNPVLDEFMALFRVLYYVVPLAILYPLLRDDRRDAVLDAGAIVILTYVVSYIGFLFLPAVSPRMVPELAALDTREYGGYLFAALERGIQGDHGAVGGNAFPSAHVSGTIAWTFVAYRYLPRHVGFGHVMTFISIGTVVSAVYLGFHHAMDPLGGIVVALVTYPLALLLIRRRRPATSESPVVFEGVQI